MKVQILGDVQKSIKDALGARLRAHRSVEELSGALKQEIAQLPGIRLENVTYSRLLGRVFDVPVSIKLKGITFQHKISASLSNNKQMVKYSGHMYNLLFDTLGCNSVQLETNLLQVKGTFSLFSAIQSSRASSASAWVEGVLAGVNRNIKSAVLCNYLNLSACISKARRSLEVEYNINRAVKVLFGAEQEQAEHVHKMELVANPVDHKSAKVIVSGGVYREAHKNSRSSGKEKTPESGLHVRQSAYNFGVNGYFRGVIPVLCLGAACKKKNVPMPGLWTRCGLLLKKLGVGSGRKKASRSFISRHWKAPSVNLLGEAEGSIRRSLLGEETSSALRVLGAVQCTIEDYAVLAGVVFSREGVQTARREEAKGQSQVSANPMFGLGYAPSSSLVDSVSVCWPIKSLLKSAGVLGKLTAFEINMSKEY
ncbi:uncharacterized protein NEMAJ01_1944 [Nematocida major]|uniref:uncharacterized protein n=1 Tax=Nematocida major TaxID=1912982 RepID=UPI00200869AD|nr:uncharacterized protein NEMAJ01_1944 [Nematocida major]KAH9387048.1 hypothetical protein NEMAJ01_1944 [Nematocida major]